MRIVNTGIRLQFVLGGNDRVTVGAFAGLAMLVQQETMETPVPRGS